MKRVQAMDSELSTNKCLIKNKDASDNYIRRSLKRKGYNDTYINNYLTGWKQPAKRR